MGTKGSRSHSRAGAGMGTGSGWRGVWPRWCRVSPRAALGHDAMGILRSPAGMCPSSLCPDGVLGLRGERTMCRGARDLGAGFLRPQFLPWVIPATLLPSIPAKRHQGCGEPCDSHRFLCLYLTPSNPMSPPLAPNSVPTLPWERSRETRALHSPCPAPGHIGGGPLAGGSSLPSEAGG